MRAIKDVRLKHYDYSANGFYFVTIVTHGRQEFFAGPLKEVVARFIGRLPEESGVKVDYHVIMNDHIHMLLVLDGCAMTLSEVVRRFKARTTREAGVRLWQPNYYEHVVRNEKALVEIRRYIENNPLAEQIDWDRIYNNSPMNRATTNAN